MDIKRDEGVMRLIKSKQNRRFLAWAMVSTLALSSLFLGACSTNEAAENEEAVESKPVVSEVIHLESFTVNLADPEESRYLRLTIHLGLAHPKHEEEEEDEEAEPLFPTARIRDTVLGVLTEWESDELLESEGKVKLKEQLTVALQKRLPELGVKEVYFTDFLVQR